MSTYISNHMAPGVHTAIEFPDRVHHHRRFGWGLYVEQDADRRGVHNNWFHIGVPHIASDRFSAGTGVKKIYVQLQLNENARFAELHLRARTRLLYSTRPNIIGGYVERTFDLSPSSGRFVWSEPFTVAMRIEFLSGTPRGAVTFFGAGLNIIIGDYDDRIS